jgi:twinkle protein
MAQGDRAVSIVIDDDDFDFNAYMTDTDAAHKVKPAGFWEDDLNAEFLDQGSGPVHPRLPWPRLREKIALRPGEVSLWFGFNGHGKSLLLGQAVLSLCAQDSRCCVASFEMRPRKTLARMARQFADAGQPGPRQVKDFVQWAQGKLWLYDQTSTVEAERVYAVIRYCVDKLKVQHFVVDNLTKCVAADDDYAGQKAVVDKLTALAQGKYEKNDIDHNQPDAVLICDKQRHGSGWEGLQNLAFHGRSMQYIERGSSATNLRIYPHEVAHA